MLLSLIFFISSLLGLAHALSVKSTILILARDTSSGQSAATGLQAYGIPYEILAVPSSGVTLPSLSSDGSTGNYGGIVIVSEVSYQYDSSYLSALTTAQWNDIYTYQATFGARLVRLDSYPSPEFGVTTALATGEGCCNLGQEQTVFFTDTSDFPTARVKTNAGLSTTGLWHYPARVTNSTVAKSIAGFGPTSGIAEESVAGIINDFGTRKQMVWFISWSADWAITSNFLQHGWIHWITRGLYTGFRRVYLSTQIDDVFLITDIYDKPSEPGFRLRPDDLTNHVAWLDSINAKMPTGSLYFTELGHNGNGDIEAAVGSSSSSDVCVPRSAIEYPAQPDVPYDFQKPLGSGTDVWPSTPTEYVWSSQCAALDPLRQWFQNPAQRDRFAHMSHTFTHYELNNATYADASKEISFNRAWLAQAGFTGATKYSGAGLIPPAITGLLNGDAIRAWMDNGITSVVGDNTRPSLLNQDNPYWPLITTEEANGHAGLLVMPRWATTIYYNCDLPACTTLEWINTSAGQGDFQNLLNDARSTNVRHLLALRQDPFMFHQANLRNADVESTSINGVSMKVSIMEAWTEVVVQELVRLTDWPIRTLKHDDLAQDFSSRMTRDRCNPQLTWNFSSDGSAIESVTISAPGNGNSCASPIPLTVPSGVADTLGAVAEQIGSDPLTLWVNLQGEPKTFTLANPVPRS